jgi:hypothetical protein
MARRILEKTTITHADARRAMKKLATLVQGELEEVELPETSGQMVKWLAVFVPQHPCTIEGCNHPAMLWLKMPKLNYYFPADLVGVEIGWVGGGNLTLGMGFRYIEPYKGYCRGHLYLADPVEAVPDVDRETGDWPVGPWIPGEWRHIAWRDSQGRCWYSDIPKPAGMSFEEAKSLYRQASEANALRPSGLLTNGVLA